MSRGWVVGQVGWGGPAGNLLIYQDGVLVREYEVAAPHIRATKVGLAQTGNGSTTSRLWDNFSSVRGTTLADTFNRADDATHIGTASDGGTWSLTSGITWGIKSNQAYMPNDSSTLLTRLSASGYTALHRDSASVPCDITVDFGKTAATAATSGILFCWDGGVGTKGSAYLVLLDGTTGSIRKVDISTDNQIDTFTIGDISTTMSTFRVVFTPEKNLAQTTVDTFNRANSSTALGTTSDSTATWIARDGVTGITSNQAVSVSTGSSGLSVATITGSADGYVDCVNSAVNGEGQVFRYSNMSNFYSIVAYAGTPGLSGLWKTEAGSSSHLKTFTINAGDTVRTVCEGSFVDCYVNGVKLASVTNSFNATATGVGVQIPPTGVLDNFATGSLS